MVSVVDVFLLVLLGVIFFVIGREYRDSTFGILSGVIIFLLGVDVFINSVSGLTVFANVVVASVFWAIGGYIFLRGGIEAIERNG